MQYAKVSDLFLVIEGTFGRYKNKGGMQVISADILAIPLYGQPISVEWVKNAMQQTSIQMVDDWRMEQVCMKNIFSIFPFNRSPSIAISKYSSNQNHFQHMKLFLYTMSALLLSIPFAINAQKLDAEATARKYLQVNKTKWQLTESDLKDIVVSDQYLTKHNGVTHVYFKQRHKGIPLHNAIANVHLLKNGTPFYATSNFTIN